MSPLVSDSAASGWARSDLSGPDGARQSAHGVRALGRVERPTEVESFGEGQQARTSGHLIEDDDPLERARPGELEEARRLGLGRNEGHARGELAEEGEELHVGLQGRRPPSYRPGGPLRSRGACHSGPSGATRASR